MSTTTAELLHTVIEEINSVVAKVTPSAVEDLAHAINVSPRIFVAGEGRSGFMAKAFAMRLMHVGLTVFVVGETTTPAVGSGDLVVAVSGSGTTAGTIRVCQSAVSAGAKVRAVTTDPASPLAELAEEVLLIPAATKYRRPDETPTIQPLSSLFDQSTHIILDVVCLVIAELRGQDNASAAARHANTE